MKYANDIFHKYDNENAHEVGNPIDTNLYLRSAADDDDDKVDTAFDYRRAICMLMYLATYTRPDLACSLGQLSRFVLAPTKQPVKCVKRDLRYLDGMINHGI